MDQKIENPDKKKSKKKRIILWVFLLLFLGSFLAFGISFFGDKDAVDNDVSQEEDSASVAENSRVDEEKDVEADNGDENLKNNANGEEEMVSENYRVTQVKFGGNVVIENGRSRDAKLEIFQVKSENIISQEDEEPRILISWKTNKEAISTVSYAKSDGTGAVNISEGAYGYDHTILLKNMEFSTIYTYKIEVKDKWGNKADTEYFSAYTGDKSESIFDLITNAVEDVFGWAMK